MSSISVSCIISTVWWFHMYCAGPKKWPTMYTGGYRRCSGLPDLSLWKNPLVSPRCSAQYRCIKRVSPRQCSQAIERSFFVNIDLLLLVSSLIPATKTHAGIGNSTLADAIMDRLVHNAYKINLKEESLRKQQANLTTSNEIE